MNCLHPFTRKYLDALTGQTKECVCPCGKCINCLHAEQDQWCIRLGETAKASKSMIYDTLTLSPYVMRYIDLLQPTSDNTFLGSTIRWRQWKVESIKKKYSRAKEIFPKMSKDSYYMLKKNDFKFLYFPKEEVQNWIKRGRQMFFRDKGYRCNVSYFIVQEYGPSTSRPHFHLLFFGLNYSDYMHYFGNPWREDFGWTKPSYFEYTAANRKDFNCITRYVSKYVSKGSFESPWVTDGFVKKPYKLISKGIGEGYLKKDFFDAFKAEDFTRWKAIHCPSLQSYETNVVKLEKAGKFEELERYKEYYFNARAAVDKALLDKEKNPSHYLDLSKLVDEQYDKLRVYYDEGGYPHKLPMYYRNKLLRGSSNEKNIYLLEVQNVLEQSARVLDNKIVQAEASIMGIRIPDSWLETDRATWKLSVRDRFMIDYVHLVNQRSKAKATGERRYTKVKNFYNRLKNRQDAPALL